MIDHAYDLALFTNKPEKAARDISFYMTTNKIELMSFKQGAISRLSGN